MEINKKQIMETFIRWIHHLSDIEYQIRVWVKGQGPECQDFDEFIDFFLDEGGDILDHYKDFGITEKQYALLIKFREAFETFVYKPRRPYLPQDFIDTPEWNKIAEMAKEVLAAFNYQKGYL